ncbi:MAG: bifunctional [glutamate--ammonia ligase]-adenylyl-L-tyrosine phosphorylase/[glutamate--ammonia-ligase] adenylyltransferase [Proteobacteria bacterium]|nr:MAG: bifunctional [glutamate--ammonia ligase]-adenylyl-L-tyrosine phosphorylase/[glutamate--ammonia-ligase] adenylyltransferase [Pseudomonadota bacterium]
MSNSSLIDLFPIEQQAQAAKVLSFSPYAQSQLERHPEWVSVLCHTRPYAEGALLQAITAEIETVKDENSLQGLVRHVRHRESLRIIWRELTGLAPLEETLRTVSDLADALVGSVLAWWHQRLVEKHGEPKSREGEPQYMLVLGMGKLGGRELNFSSDIDLIFAFPEGGETDGRRALDNQTFFIRLGQKLINTLGQITADGFAYRVDMRLRPFGDVGALALSFDAMEHYYQAHGREWERYALVKARVMAGRPADGEELMQRLQPFIYRRYLDYGAIEQLRDMKMMVNREAQRKGKRNDVKLGLGGIRELEFTAQVFQLMRGGREPALQQRNLLKTLAVLESMDLLSQQDAQQLHEAYHFLRQTENRVQMWKDEQTHALPDDLKQQALLAESMGFTSWDSFLTDLDLHRHHVAQIFQRIFAVEDEDKQEQHALAQLWQGEMEDEQAKALLEAWNFQPADHALQKIKDLHEGRLYSSLTDLAHKRLNRLMPDLLAVCSKQDNPVQALERSLRVIQAVARRSGYMAMLADHPAALGQFVKLVHASSWITTQLTQYPILLDSLLDAGSLYQPLNRQELGEALQETLASVDPEDTEQVMERMRQFKQAQVLRVAAADITGVLPLMIVSDQLTWIAEVILEAAASTIWQSMTHKHGVPCYSVNGEQHEADFAIVGYGKLGGLELGYGSDLDIVFLHNSTGDQQQTNGVKPLENQVFFVRVAQKIIHLLSTFTHDGRLYETDTRLRPSGSSGLLVSSLDAFRQYQQEKAWIWEHQALLRARAVNGSGPLRVGFDQIRHDIICQPRDTETLRAEVVSMRQKMWDKLGSKDANVFDLKKDPGGITDIEFMVQYLLLAHASQYPELAKWSDNIRQLDSLGDMGILSAEQVTRLQDIYRNFRNRVHKQALQELTSKVDASLLVEEREFVQQCWSAWMLPA